jgi:hypothetical protein
VNQTRSDEQGVPADETPPETTQRNLTLIIIETAAALKLLDVACRPLAVTAVERESDSVVSAQLADPGGSRRAARPAGAVPEPVLSEPGTDAGALADGYRAGHAQVGRDRDDRVLVRFDPGSDSR